MLEVFENISEEDIEETAEIWDYGIDFDTGQLTGEIVHGVDALKVWIFFALQVARYRYRAFSWNYGSETDDMIGKSYGRDYTESEVKRMISECVCCHPNIDSCDNFTVNFEDSLISVSFSIVTDFGDTDFEIELTGG
ncbi:MAG: DUF2634 domain-containing protein [Faecalibacterium sp.]|nr:DUF2634 domain-containing protein [Ruminococcus sp.]MCM1392114.1 DUF2634 domain-containing protein [Ruminococcus sp.]MCM1485811.1 DUF2634 domain-containing protein [Faecalibacterium sp.]